jgi:hypothetical protein
MLVEDAKIIAAIHAKEKTEEISCHGIIREYSPWDNTIHKYVRKRKSCSRSSLG